MTGHHRGHVAIVYPGNYEARLNATPGNNRLALIFKALHDVGLHAEPAVYHDRFCDEVRRQLAGVDAVLVWMNPIQDGRDRSMLDAMLREVSAQGVFVSAHPDIILKMGTKEVVYRTRELGWGCDTHLYRSMDEMRRMLPGRLTSGNARVLKQYRGNGGLGVWKVEWDGGTTLPQPVSIIRVRQARRGGIEEQITLDDFFRRCAPYFEGDGRMVDQAYQERLPDGMIRCYLVHDRIAGFGHQAVNALFPAPPGAPPSDAPEPGPRLYYPPTRSEFQLLKRNVEQQWVPAMQRMLAIRTEELPILWDCDFLLGPQNRTGEDTYVLCEINVSSIAPFPESAAPYVAQATLARIREIRKKRKPTDR